MPNTLCCVAGSTARVASIWTRQRAVFSCTRPAAPSLIALSRYPASVRTISSFDPASASPKNNARSRNSQAITWLSQNPQLLTPDHVTSAYPHLQPTPRQNSTVPVLFASLEFASWTDPSGPLLGKWVNPLFKSIHPGESPTVVYTVVAVVDKIPTPRNTNNASNASLGAEGLSLLLVEGSEIAVTTSRPAQVRSSDSAEPAFFFSMHSTSSDFPNSETSCEVGLRLANTVFVNGKDRTLLGMRWAHDPVSEEYVLDNWKDLSVCDINSFTKKAHSSVSIPLHPVTQRRSVVSSMGNILRQLSSKSSSDAHSTSTIPASSELEKELPRYVSDLGIPHQRVAVWALVEPLNALFSEKYSRNDLNQSILNGNRIHRVVSGGGGWGKKQGLLSLDPEISFRDQFNTTQQRPVSLDQAFEARYPNTIEPEDTSDISEPFGRGLEENIASLSQVAPAGDNIQFFVATEPGAAETTAEQLHEMDSRSLSCSFAVGASVGAELTIPSSSTPQDTPSDELVIIPNHFGGLSETAISFSQKLPLSSSTDDGECRTKISVPGSRVELLLS